MIRGSLPTLRVHRCEGATLVKSETEINYTDEGGKKTDILLEVDGTRVGVSVTRAYHYPPSEPLTDIEAQTLMLGKLEDVLLSAANASPDDAWERSVLHVMAYDEATVQTVQDAYASLESTTTSDTIVVLTRTDGWDDFLY